MIVQVLYEDIKKLKNIKEEELEQFLSFLTTSELEEHYLTLKNKNKILFPFDFSVSFIERLRRVRKDSNIPLYVIIHCLIKKYERYNELVKKYMKEYNLDRNEAEKIVKRVLVNERVIDILVEKIMKREKEKSLEEEIEEIY